LQLTYLALPQMLTRRRGVIVNVSSLSDMGPVPLVSVYAATKVRQSVSSNIFLQSFIARFTAALQNEYAGKGVTIQCIAPAYVSTKLSQADVSFFSPDPATFARSAIGTIGILPRTPGYWTHQMQVVLCMFAYHKCVVQAEFASLIPVCILTTMMRKVLEKKRSGGRQSHGKSD
jgi:17beta-estradiol 17-dehydrogenase / very-long-chain 3-oxoacyl-CoA reductase